MINLSSIWQILVTFEIALFSSYTLIMYIFSKKKVELSEIDYLPTITLLIPMYNEEKIIKEKIENTSQLDYPEDRLKIILLDDHSTDNSKDISIRAIQEQSLNAKVIESKGRCSAKGRFIITDFKKLYKSRYRRSYRENSYNF
jgi:cellulose synthase/poly-beta-1,6-N-acetylglucosamine synthase-like glycosyltransferase